jgi:hypothetical protein
MTVKEIMERVGITKTGLAVAYIKDGLDEIAQTIDDNIEESIVDVNKGTREYAIPTELQQLRKIFILNDSGDWQSIPRLTHGPAIEK